MEDKKVSIIVPVYNVEQYISECVRSLCDQTYKNLEIILVDDGSKDNSPQICDEFAGMDSRIRVIHKTNGGAASARNMGIDHATGDYICFVDGDDMVAPEYVSQLAGLIRENDADIAVCGFFYWRRSEREPCSLKTTPGVYGRDAYLLQFLRDWSCSLIWNKIFRRETIGKIRMEEGHRVDDEYFTYQVCMNCKTVAVTEQCLYQYRLRASSVMQDMASLQEKIMLDRIGYVAERYQNIASHIPQLKAAFLADAVDTLVRYWKHSKDMPDAMKAIRRWMGAHIMDILRMNASVKQKLAVFINIYLIRPAVVAEANPLQYEQNEYFD